MPFNTHIKKPAIEVKKSKNIINKEAIRKLKIKREEEYS